VSAGPRGRERRVGKSPYFMMNFSIRYCLGIEQVGVHGWRRSLPAEHSRMSRAISRVSCWSRAATSDPTSCTISLKLRPRAGEVHRPARARSDQVGGDVLHEPGVERGRRFYIVCKAESESRVTCPELMTSQGSARRLASSSACRAASESERGHSEHHFRILAARGVFW